ncbi:FG-GAP-like repeat-containing protein [Myxococcota bacterium]|nr:FG-GAP-like repeat-containing protein [Myxococcota bacterium]
MVVLRFVALWAGFGLVGGCYGGQADAGSGADADAAPAAPTSAEPTARTEAAASRSGRGEILSRGSAGTYAFRGDARGGLTGSNRAQGLLSRFDAGGVAVSPGAGAGGAITLRLVGWGGDRIAPARGGQGPELGACQSDGAVDADGECLRRVEYVRGDVTEWWENSPRGLEQGFTVARRAGSPGGLVLDLALDGAVARVEASGTAAELQGESGAALRYSGLRAWDAAGRDLPAAMEPRPGGLRLRVDDRGAAYPVTVDPLLTSPAWTADGDQQAAYFGQAVAPAGDVNGDGFGDVIVGAPDYDDGEADEGGAFVFLGSATGLAATPDWTASGEQAGTKFGYSVSSAGDVNGDGYADVVVGSPFFDVAGNYGGNNDGKAYLYLGSASGLSAVPAWTAESAGVDAWFGHSVSAAGDVNGDGYGDVLVGAPYHNQTYNYEGRALLYTGSPSGLSATPAWTVDSGAEDVHLGFSVSSAGDVNGDGYGDVVVGLPGNGWDNGSPGQAWVYLGSPSGLAAGPAWTNWVDQGQAQFGYSVASAGDVNGDGYGDVVVGAYAYGNGQTAEGGAFLYLGDPGGLSATPAWTAEPDLANARFGESVSSAGDVNGDGYADVVVGAPYASDVGQYEGRSTLYFGSPGGLGATPAWTFEGDQAYAMLGRSSAAGDVNGDGFGDVLVGAQGYNNGLAAQGRAFLFPGSGAGLASSESWTGSAGVPSSFFGCALASAGDVNGDGYGDVIVGAREYGPQDVGVAFVHLGTSSGLSEAASWSAGSEESVAYFGWSVASAGDVNGDGYGDVVVGAPREDGGEEDEGRAHLFLGSASGLAGTAAWTGEADQASAAFGTSVASAGDVNGDGYGDIVVGAPYYDAGHPSGGRAYLYLGSSSGLAASPAWTADADEDGAWLGWSVAAAGDVNGDGYGDVVVGARAQDGVELDEGRAYLFLGSAAGLSADPAWSAGSGAGSQNFGHAVASAGDVNGDGYGDVIVGAPGYAGGQSGEGRAYVYLGSASGLSPTPAWDVESDQENANLGGSVGSAGDVDGDGYGDVVVGAYRMDGGETDEGRAWVYRGSASGLEPVASWTAEPDEANAQFGHSVSSAGDVDGDGFGDLAVGAPYFDYLVGGGGAFVYLGNGGDGTGPGVPRVSQARRPGSSTPVLPGGFSGVDGSFDVAAEGRGAFGRGRVKLQVEVKPLGTPFDGTGLVEGGTFADTGVAGVALQETVSGLADTASFHWRARLLADPALGLPQGWSTWLQGGVSGDAAGMHVRTGSPDEDGDLYSAWSGDCDDVDGAVHPGATEDCDGLDNDCDGAVDDAPDGDGDGYTPCDGDCDDAEASVHPGAAESCNGLDDDCDGQADDGLVDDGDGDGYTTCDGDCDDSGALAHPGAAESCNGLDDDCDGSLPYSEADQDADGWTPCDGDCDDRDAATSPGAPEACDGADNDCDGTVDESLDTDGDGVAACDGDCDDVDPSVFPGAVEACDGVDQDCDGTADDGLTVDADGDGHSTLASCAGTQDDCDDGAFYTHPGAPEACDGLDDDCDGLVPRGERDSDGDGQRRCEADCNDQDATTFDGAPEVCDGMDNDCDDVLPGDELDADADGYALCALDCDDTDPALSPGLPEVCGDGADNDCSGTADDGCPVTPTPGSLVVTEVLINPSAALDSKGEWLEVLNLSGDTLDLDGVTFASNSGTRTLTSTVLVAPGEYAVLGRNGSPGQNGGVTMDAVYGNTVLFDNGTDTLTVTAPGDVLLDALTWGVGDAPTGASLTLGDGALDPDLNDDLAAWCEATSPFGGGDLGTPGAPNDHCPQVVAPAPGDLVVTEILADPGAVADVRGEWFEVANVSADILELDGVAITTTGGSATITGSVQVPVGGYAVLGRYGNPAQNGGVTPDYVYGNAPSLAEGGDTLTLTAPDASVLDTFTWGAGVFTAGTALSLDPSMTDDLANDDAGAWCAATDPFGDGDLGTPGAANPSCGP